MASQELLFKWKIVVSKEGRGLIPETWVSVLLIFLLNLPEAQRASLSATNTSFIHVSCIMRPRYQNSLYLQSRLATEPILAIVFPLKTCNLINYQYIGSRIILKYMHCLQNPNWSFF